MADTGVNIHISATGDPGPIDKIAAALAALKGQGQEAAQAHEELGKSSEEVKDKVKDQGEATKRTTEQTEDAGRKADRAGISFGQLARQIGAVAVAWKAWRAAMSFVSGGIDFNKQLETASLGVAAIIRQFDNTGTINSFTDAQIKAATAVDMLRQKAAESPATFAQLAQSFQGTAGSMAQAGLSIRQQVDLVVLMSQSLAALGIRSDQILQESRALVTGNITEDAMAARILGITKAQIDQAKEQGRLYEFLSGQLSAFAEAGKEAAKTYEVSASNMQDATDALEAQVTEELFKTLAKTFREWTVAINETTDGGGLRKLGVMLADVAKMAAAVVSAFITLAPALVMVGWEAAAIAAGLYAAKLIGMIQALGGITAAAKGVGVALKAMFLGNPLGIALAAVAAIGAALWQWSSATRAAATEMSQFRKETLLMREAFPARLQAIETEANALDLLNELEEKRNELLKQQREKGLNDAERLRLRVLNDQVAQVKILSESEAALQRNRDQNALRAQQETALRQADANISALTAPTDAAQLAQVQQRLGELPAGDLQALIAERKRLMSEETWNIPEDVAALMPAPRLRTDTEVSADLRANALAIAQLKERADLEAKERELLDNLAQDRSALTQEEITGLDLAADAARRSFDRREISAAQYRDKMLGILDEREKREQEVATAGVHDEQLRAAISANLTTQYAQQRGQVETDIQQATLDTLSETWKAYEDYYKKRLEAIDDERQKLLADATPEAIEKANALWAARKKLIEEAAAKAKELNEQASAAGIDQPVNAATGQSEPFFSIANLPEGADLTDSAPDAETLAGAWRAYTDAARQAWTAGNAAFTGLNAITNGLSRGIAGLIDGTMSLGQAFSTMGQTILQAFAMMIAQAIAFAIVMTVVNALTGGAGSAFMGAMGGISTFMGGFAEGGYTGHGGKYQPAGIVHRGEYVLDADTTSRLGVARLDALVEAVNRPLPGYDTGGFVGPMGGGSSGAMGTAMGGQTSIALIGMESEFRRWLESGAGNKVLYDVNRRSLTRVGAMG